MPDIVFRSKRLNRNPLEMGIGWPCERDTSPFLCHLQTATVWPLSRRCIPSDTCNNSVNGTKIELTLKADSSPSWRLKALDEPGGQWQLGVLVLLPEMCVIRKKVRHRLQSSISQRGKWYVHHCLWRTSRALSACMHITCVKAARDMTRETESHHQAATQGVSSLPSAGSHIQSRWGLYSDLWDVVDTI